MVRPGKQASKELGMQHRCPVRAFCAPICAVDAILRISLRETIRVKSVV
jgi:hypothetical protein